MDNLTQLTDRISRLTIPFSDVYTTVFIIKTDKGVIIFDTATYASDVDTYIVPALYELGITTEMLKYVFLSHSHGDHAGGLARLVEIYKDISIVSRSTELLGKYKDFQFIFPEDGQEICSGFCAFALPGHSEDSMILFDKESKVALTGDSLQMYGLFGSGEWGANIGMPKEHITAVEKLERMDIECIYTSHDYHPHGYAYRGKENVEMAFKLCIEPIMKIAELIRDNPTLPCDGIKALYHSKEKLPTVRLGVFEAVKKAVTDGKI